MEIGDPANYVLPDVNCDFTKVTMTQTDDKNVKIQGAIGKPPTETFKVSATYMDGFKATTVSIINGGQAGAKAHAVANAILDRSRAINKFMGMGDFEDTYVTAIGNEESFGKNASKVCCQFSCFTMINCSFIKKTPYETKYRKVTSSSTPRLVAPPK